MENYIANYEQPAKVNLISRPPGNSPSAEILIALLSDKFTVWLERLYASCSKGNLEVIFGLNFLII